MPEQADSKTTPTPPVEEARWERPLEVLVVAGLCAASFLAVLRCGAFTGSDAFYHLTVARQMLSDGLFAGISSLPYTVLGTGGPDHHFFFHLLLLPFTVFEPFLALRLAAAVFAIVPTVGLYVFLRWTRVPVPALLVVLLYAASELYPFRSSLLRAQSIGIPFLVFSVLLLVRRSRYGLLALAYVFSLSYHGSMILVPVALLTVLSMKLSGKRVDVRSVGYAMAGLALGQVLNPFFPANIEYLLFHSLYKTSNPAGLPVGAEWFPLPPGFLLAQIWLLVLPLGAALVYWLRKRYALAPETLTLTALLLLFAGMSLKYARFLEYAIPCGALAAGLALRDSGLRPKRLLWGAALLLCIPAGYNLAETHELLNRDHPPEKYAAVAEYLEGVTEVGEVVVNLRWDEYPVLLHHDQRNRWATGLDPNYLFYASPERSALLYALLYDEEVDPELPGKVLAAFGSRFLVSSPERRSRLAAFGTLRPVLETRWAIVWTLVGRPMPRSAAPREQSHPPGAVSHTGPHSPCDLTPAGAAASATVERTLAQSPWGRPEGERKGRASVLCSRAAKWATAWGDPEPRGRARATRCRS